jgi:microcystin degradation protein MlrC
MRPHLFVAGLAQETNAFGPLPTTLEDFSGRFQTPGRHDASTPPFPESLLNETRKRAADNRCTLTEGPTAGAHPSGIVTRDAYEQLRDAILIALGATLPVDIVALHLHGAMCAEGYPDCEGDLLMRIRDIVGPKAKIGAMLDPHANLSAAMVAASNILIAYKGYPHTDFRERAVEVVDLLLAAHAGTIDPVSSVWDAGVIGIFHTTTPQGRSLVAHMQAMEERGDALSASLIHGFPWADTEDMGTRALVITNGNRDASLAEYLAREAALIAPAIMPRATPLADAFAAFERAREAGLTVFADGPDNPGGGAGGDSTFVLRELLDRNIAHACLGPLWDPISVAAAFGAGVGAQTDLVIGGKAGPLSGQPIRANVEIRHLAPEGWQTFAGTRFGLGRCATVRLDGIDVLLASERDQARGTDLFTNHGVDLAEKKLAVVKSSQHFYESFSRVASRIVYLDCPGSLQTDLSRISYRHVHRPRWPIDPVGAQPSRIFPPPR